AGLSILFVHILSRRLFTDVKITGGKND
ncbi:MAG: hypothetical protein K0R07_1553, partial [Sedimentibacter sp.]|nr:hypothetical protein [Sedimentibacter sp.]